MMGSGEMHFGVSMFHTDYSIPAMQLAGALEERGFESMWAPEHSHIPVPRRTPFPGGGELPKPYYEVMGRPPPRRTRGGVTLDPAGACVHPSREARGLPADVAGLCHQRRVPLAGAEPDARPNLHPQRM